MDDELLRRLRAEQARALLYDADPHHAVMLACDLLVTGVDGDAVVGHEGSPLGDLLPTVAALATDLEDDLGGRTDDDLQTRLAALARTILSPLTAKNST
ncbi:hypothetical protein ACFHW0_31125 [Micromonospora sp. LOL_025]|uniref:hypothetical protein n=1 Tax=Micromonospora sp. LOL_025 TaxID=3345413 RepID=UPI003A8BE96D